MDLAMFARGVRSAISSRSGAEPNEDESGHRPARVGMVMDMSDANFIGGLIPG